MKNIQNAPFVADMIQTASNMYRLGWDERNSGNISLMLEKEDLSPYLDINDVRRTIPTGFCAAELAGRYFLVTGSGKYFKNMALHAEEDLGIIRIAEDGENAELLWGFSDGGTFTSELPSFDTAYCFL